MLEIVECEQGTPEWYRHRMAIPTASEFATVMAKGKNGNPSKVRDKYLRQLAGEIITGEPMENYTNAYMERGKLLEPEIRNLYCMFKDYEVRQVGFLRNGRTGASPDGLIGDDGMLEIKSEAPHLLIETILADKIPPEHYAQLQGNLLVAGREWIDIAIGYKRMPLVIKRTGRDEAYLKTLNDEIDRFLDELDVVVQKVRNYAGA
jgi:hypothetical protein